MLPWWGQVLVFGSVAVTGLLGLVLVLVFAFGGATREGQR